MAAEKQPSSACSPLLPAPFDPFREPATAGGVLRGDRLGLVLDGRRLRTPAGARIVLGSVRGHAVRSRQYLDIELDHIATWIHGERPIDLETLDPGFRSTFKVEIVGSVRATLGTLVRPGLDGRTLIPAREIPRNACERCGTELGGAPFCGGCGMRASVGLIARRRRSRPHGADVPFCAGCWRQRPGPSPFCRHCGYEHALSSRAESVAGANVTALLMSGRRRIGRFRARIERARTARIYPDGWPQLVLTVSDVLALDPQEGDLPVPSDYRSTLICSVDRGRFDVVLADIAAGRMVRVAEPRRRCVSCAVPRHSTAPYVNDRYCTRCGVRGRIAPAAGAQARGLRHACGYPTVPNARHCGGCGAEILEIRSRFALLR